MAEAGELVQLYVYDLSGGMARAMSQMLLGRQIEAIYHTSIVVGGMEHFFGGGINVAPAGSTPFGSPMQTVDLGRTQLPEGLRAELLAELGQRYTPQAYSLFHNNCNTFSDELAQLLCGRGIPPHITALPAEVLATPFGQMIAPMLTGLEQQMRGMRQQAAAPDAAQPAAGEAPGAAASEAPVLHAAEVEIDAAVAAGMMREAQATLREGGAPAAAPISAAGLGAAPPAGQASKLDAELAVQAEFERLMATGAMGDHEALAAALESVAIQQSLAEEQPQAGAGSQPQ